MNYTSNMLKGIGTSKHVQEMHYRAALKVNYAMEQHRLVMADATRTKSEKAPLLSQLQRKLETEAARDVLAMRNNINARLTELQTREDAILAGMSMVDALALVSAMKGLDASQMIAAAKESRELSLAMAIVPSQISGFSKDQAMATLIATHHADIKEAQDALDGDISAFASLERNVENVVRTLGFDVDLKALESRVDPSKLEITPPPLTMAQQNAELAELERASGIEAENPNKAVIERFDGKIAGYHARQGDKPSQY